MLACVLLAAMLGGIAMANPDALKTGTDPSAGRGGASHGGGTAFHDGGPAPQDPDAPGGAGRDPSDGSQERPAVDVRTVHDCRAIVAHLEGDLVSGNHHGLEQALEVVSRNCSSHAEVPGLARALERLVANAERFLDRHGEGPGAEGDPPGHDPSGGNDGGSQGSRQRGGSPQRGGSVNAGSPNAAGGAGGNGHGPP